MRYFRVLLHSATQSLGALLGETLNANETTSGSAYRRRNTGRRGLYRAVNALFFWQEDHCFESCVRECGDCLELLEAQELDTLVQADIFPRLEKLLERAPE